MVCKDRTVSGGAEPQDSTFCLLQKPISEICRAEVNGGQAGGDGQVVPEEEQPVGLWWLVGEREKAKGPSAGRKNDQEFEWGRIKNKGPQGAEFLKLCLSGGGSTAPWTGHLRAL